MRASDFEAAVEEMEERYGRAYAVPEREAIWKRIQWFNEADFDSVLVKVYEAAGAFLPAAKVWLSAADIVSPRTSSPDTSSKPVGRLVPREWVQAMRDCMAMERGPARDREMERIKALRLPSQRRDPYGEGV